MADALQSILSVQSVAVQSKVSMLSVAATKTNNNASPTNPPKQPSGMVTKTAKSETHKSTKGHSASHSATSTAGSGGSSGGVSGGVIAGIIVLVVFAAAGIGFLIWRWHRKKAANASTGLWANNSAYKNKSDMAGDRPTGPEPYVFLGGGGTDETRQQRPLTIVPPPPEKEDRVPETSVDSTDMTVLLSPPSPVHAPRPRSPEMPDPYATVQATLANNQHQRNDSGPELLYSTPKIDRDYSFDGPSQRPSSPGVLSSKTAFTSNSMPNPYQARSSYGDAPPLPMPVPIPAPVPSPPISAVPSPHASVLSSKQAPRLTLTPSKGPMIVEPLPDHPAPPAYTREESPISNTRGKICIVIRTYVPSLLDELRVNVGEKVVLVNEFDDGWGYCERIGDADGAAGVVPLECLDRSGNATPPGASRPGSLVADGGNNHRISARFSSFHVDFDSVRTSYHEKPNH